MLSENEIKTILVVVIPIVLALACWKVRLLTADGALASVVVGYIIGFSTNLECLLVLILFTVIGFGVTLYRLHSDKTDSHVDGDRGERTWKNVLGVSIPCCAFAVATMFFPADSYEYRCVFVGYIASVAVASADTAASEIGIKDKDVWMITTGKRVEPGVDGGISLIGTSVCVLAAVITSLFAWWILSKQIDGYVLIPIFAGIVGCMLDSIIGATWETKGYVSKYGNNCITGIAGGLIGVIIAMMM